MKTTNHKGSLTLVPAGGLANRMRAVASAYRLCLAVGSRLHVVWFRDWALNAPFVDIFEPIEAPGIDLREAGVADAIVNGRPAGATCGCRRCPRPWRTNGGYTRKASRRSSSAASTSRRGPQGGGAT